MFITGILLSIWIILFDGYYTFLFSICLISVFTLEVYVDFIFISTYWFLRTNPSVLCSCFLSPQSHSISSNEISSNFSTIQFQNPVRRSMFLRIQKLFRTKTSNSTDQSIHPKSSPFDYRCPVCLNHEQDTFPWIALGCGHILCSFCTQHLYFGNKPICPHCRSSIILSDLTILYV